VLEATCYEPVFSPRRGGILGCHAPTLTALPDGSFLCAWFGGPEGSARSAIFVARRGPEGWAPPERVADVGPAPHWNPVLFVDGDTVYLFFKVGAEPWCWETYWTSRPVADPHGWREATPLVPGDVGGRGPVKNKPLRLDDGSWLAPASVEGQDIEEEGDGPWDCFVDRSGDRGASWDRADFVARPPGVRIIQPSLWHTPSGIHMLARSNAGCLFRSDSVDGGRTWSAAAPTEIPNNNSGIDLAPLPSGALALVYNPIAVSFGRRTPLDVALSPDGGDTFVPTLRLEDEPGEYSYPAVVSTPDGIAIAYTWRRRTIAFCLLAEVAAE